MKIRFSIIFFIFICLFLSTPHAQANNDDITKGLLDLRQVSLENKTFELTGAWEFYWKDFLTPEDFRQERNYRTYISVPNIWSQASYSDSPHLSNEGYGTYRLEIRVGEKEKEQLMSLYVPSVASAYKLWVNGELLKEKGLVGVNRASMEPMSYAEVFSFIPHDTSIEIIMQVSNFSQRKGGMWAPIKFGYNHEVNQLREYTMIRELVMSSTLLALSFYLLSLYFFKRSNTLPLFLGGFCLLVSLRTLLVGDRLFMYFFPSFSWDYGVKLEYLTFYIGFMLILFYLHTLFPNETNPKLHHSLVAGSVLFSLTTLFPTYLFTRLYYIYQLFLIVLLLYHLYVVTLAYHRKREGALLNLCSICLFIFAVINDYLYYNFWINGVELTSFAAGFYLLIQAVIIAKKSSQAIYQVEELSLEMQKTNELLEQKIKERTLNLYEKNKQLQHIEQTRKAFFSALTHEIRTPIQTIQGYVQLIQTKIQPEKDEKFLEIITEKAKTLNHLSKDLLDLAKLDEGQSDFQWEEIDSTHLLEHLYEQFSFDIENGGITSCYYPPENLPKGYHVFLQLDVAKIEQVFTNLIQNAIKFTPKEGIIAICGYYKEEKIDMSDYQSYFLMEVKDSGKGIEESLLPSIFERFVKGKDAISRRGTGLGLAISHEIIKQHKGKITVTSTYGSGSSFLIELPCKLVKMEEMNE
jgi:signal transduction histidine kinase